MKILYFFATFIFLPMFGMDSIFSPLVVDVDLVTKGMPLIVNNQRYVLTNGTEDQYAQCHSSLCDQCSAVLGKNDKIISYKGTSYHLKCWKALSLSFGYQSNHNVSSPFSTWAKAAQFFIVPAALYFGLEDHNCVASGIALLGTALTGWYAQNFLKNNAKIKLDDVDIECDIQHDQVTPRIIRDECSCSHCGLMLSQQSSPLIPVMTNNKLVVHHQACAQRKAKHNANFASQYKKARSLRGLYTVIPTPLHLINCIAGSYLLYAASEAIATKLSSLIK